MTANVIQLDAFRPRCRTTAPASTTGTPGRLEALRMRAGALSAGAFHADRWLAALKAQGHAAPMAEAEAIRLRGLAAATEARLVLASLTSGAR